MFVRRRLLCTNRVLRRESRSLDSGMGTTKPDARRYRTRLVYGCTETTGPGWCRCRRAAGPQALRVSLPGTPARGSLPGITVASAHAQLRSALCRGSVGSRPPERMSRAAVCWHRMVRLLSVFPPLGRAGRDTNMGSSLLGQPRGEEDGWDRQWPLRLEYPRRYGYAKRIRLGGSGDSAPPSPLWRPRMAPQFCP